MENASKALIMAGEVLIALLVISLLVLFFNNIKNFDGVKENVNISEQVTEYNKQYDAYYRNNLYGSDILSLANKVHDYNKTESETEGYKQLEMQVTFKSKISAYGGEIIVNKKDIYTAKDLKEKALYLQDCMSKYGDEQVGKYKVKNLSGLTTSELKQLLGTEYIENVQRKISKYLGYKSSLATLKARTFSVIDYSYDEVTGRVILMKFKEN